MRRFTLAAAITVAVALTTPNVASASCQTHRCWHKVHVHRVEHLFEKRIAAITPYRCGPERSVVPCWIINSESATDGYWLALNGGHLNPGDIPCIRRACGLYQMLGAEKHVPWPVVVRSKLRTLKNKLVHHREARKLWGEQRAGAACHWCY